MVITSPVARACAALFLVVVATRSAAAETCRPLVVRNPHGNYLVPGALGDIPYSDDAALDAYIQQGDPRRPSVVIIHGGGWSSGSRVAHIGQAIDLVTRAGYHWFALDYRLGGLARFEDSLADLRAALAFIRCRAGDFRIDPDRLILFGEDTGAQLAALLAAERPAGVIGAVLIGGFYDLRKAPGLRDLDQPLLERASPAALRARVPPLLLVHGGADGESPAADARAFCDDVVRRKDACEFVEAHGAGHRFENWWPSQWAYKQVVLAWLRSRSGNRRFPHTPRPGPIRKDVIYSRAHGLALDAFMPASRGPVPAVIVVHGGGWEAGDKVTYVTPLFEPLARARLAWFSIDYRLTPAVPYSEQLADVREAIRYVRAHSADFNIDPRRVFLVGESASGHIVSQIATEDSSLAGVVSFYGVYDLGAMVTDASLRSLLVRLFRRTVLDDESREVLRRHSPQHLAHKEMPPMLLVNGTGERLWAQGQAFAQRLAQLGVKHEVIALEGAPHGMENWEGHPRWTIYKARVVEWILQQAGQEATAGSRR